MRRIKIKPIPTILAIIWIIMLTIGMQTNIGAAPLYGKFKEIKYFNENGFEGILICFNNIQEHTSFTLANPDRIILDFKYSLYDGAPKTLNSTNSLIKSIRYAQFEKDVVRVVLDLYSAKKYKVEQGKEFVKVYIGDNLPQDIENKDYNNQSKENGEGYVAKEGERDDLAGSRSGDNRDSIALSDDISVAYISRGTMDQITISFKDEKNFEISTLTQPERIIIDISGAKFKKDQQEITLDGNLIQSLRFAQYQENLGRLVFDLSEKPIYKAYEAEGKLVLSIEKLEYKNINIGNISYSSENDRVYFIIKGARLTEGGKEPKEHYSGRYDAARTTYTITFPSEYASLPNCIMEINDHLFESVTVAKNLITKKTRLIFKAKDKFIYEVITRLDVGDTAINILRPESNRENTIVIDAGHGGSEPGAVYNKIMEKDLNLDIALRLNELLKGKGIKTYMIREDDSYVDLYERANIANSLEARLFLSIHNNAIGDPNFDGTMTLYNINNSSRKSFNSRDFAKNIQDSLIGILDSKDRGIRERTDLVVLKYTKMPAALAEVAFLTNQGDRNKLLTPEFRQKAAQALCDAVVKSLSEMEVQ